MAGDIDKIKGIRDEIPTPKKKEDIRDPEVFREKYLKVGQTEEEQKQDSRKKKAKQAEEEKKDQEQIAAPEGPQADVAFTDIMSDADLESSEFEVEGSGGPKRTLGASRKEGATSGKSGYAPTVSEEDYWGTSSNDIQYGESPEMGEAPPTPPPVSEEQAPPPQVAAQSEPPPPQPVETPPEPPPVSEPEVAAAPPAVEQPEELSDPSSQTQPVENNEPAIPNEPVTDQPSQNNEQNSPETEKTTQKKEVEDEFMLGSAKPKKMSLKQKRFIAKQKKLQEARDKKKAPTTSKEEQQKDTQTVKSASPKEQDNLPKNQSQETTLPYQTTKEGQKIPLRKGEKQELGHVSASISSHETKEQEGGEKDSDTGDERNKQDQQQGGLAAAAMAGSGVTPITGFNTAVPGVETVQGARPSLLPQDMEAIINRVAGVITVMKEGGQTTTSVEVHMPGSVFDGSTIVLKESDTAKGTFNLQFQGSPDAINMFNASAADLAASLQGRRFQVNILTSELSKKHRASYRVQDAKDKGST